MGKAIAILFMVGLGAVLIVAGVAMVSIPVAYIVAGMMLVTVGLLVEFGEAPTVPLAVPIRPVPGSCKCMNRGIRTSKRRKRRLPLMSMRDTRPMVSCSRRSLPG